MLDTTTNLKSLLNDPTLLCEKAYVAGTWVEGKDGATFPVTNPARGDVIANVADLSRAQVAEAIAKPKRRKRIGPNGPAKSALSCCAAGST